MKPVIHIMIEMGHVFPDISYETTTDVVEARKRLRHLSKYLSSSVYLQHANGDVEHPDGRIEEKPWADRLNAATAALRGEKPTCATCQHWIKDAIGEMGDCTHANVPSTSTHKDFGCIHHTPKVKQTNCTRCGGRLSTFNGCMNPDCGLYGVNQVDQQWRLGH